MDKVKYIKLEDTKTLLERKELFKLYVRGYYKSPYRVIFDERSIRYLITEIKIKKLEYFIQYQKIPEDIIDLIITKVISNKSTGRILELLFCHQVLNERQISLLLDSNLKKCSHLLKCQELSEYIRNKYLKGILIPINFFKTYYRIDKELSLSLLKDFEKTEEGVYGYYFNKRYPLSRRQLRIYSLKEARESKLRTMDKVFVRYEDIIYIGISGTVASFIDCEDKFKIIETTPSRYRRKY